MNKFGQIKSNIESLMTKSYGKNSFKTNMKSFKSHIIENEKLAKAYFLYDELSKKKGLSKDIVDDYVNECVETIKVILTTESTKLKEVNMWVSEGLKTNSDNNYTNIDTVVYSSSIKNLEKVLECKNTIKKLLGESEEVSKVTESVNIPLSSMLKIATNTFNREYGDISEEEKKELKNLLSLSKTELAEEITISKSIVLEKLSEKVNESNDEDLNNRVNETINRINKSEISLTSLYKLKQLEHGL
jgi:hypothetical protein|tara:strand:+ start:1849 stop:2583 length:735 start_codon:yes stop_codon:yes gene_type:complete